MKFLVIVSMLVSVYALSIYDFNKKDIKQKVQYAKCIKSIKKNCKINFQYQAKSLIKTCRLLVIHNHNINQIKNANTCIRKQKHK